MQQQYPFSVHGFRTMHAGSYFTIQTVQPFSSHMNMIFLVSCGAYITAYSIEFTEEVVTSESQSRVICIPDLSFVVRRQHDES